MTSADSLSLILLRLDEIERKLDRMMEELQSPTAIGYSQETDLLWLVRQRIDGFAVPDVKPGTLTDEGAILS